MISISSSISCREVILSNFARELNIPIKTPRELKNTVVIMRKILGGIPVEFMKIPERERTLISRVMTLKAMMLQSDLGRINAVGTKSLRATAALRGEMKDLIRSRMEQLEGCKELCQEILTGLSQNSRIPFMIAVEGFYSKALSANLPPEEASVSALVKGMLRYVMRETDINKNQGLRKALEEDQELNNYICIFTQDLVGSDAVFLSREGTNNSPQRYHRENITEWLEGHDTDPMTRAPRTLADIQSDPHAEQFIKVKIPSWINSLEGDAPLPFHSVQVLTSKGVLLAVAAAFPVVKEKYGTVLEDLQDTKKAMIELESFGEEVMNRFLSLVKGISMSGKEVPSPCYPHVEKFIRQAAEKLKDGISFGQVRVEFQSTLRTFALFFHSIGFDSLPMSLKEKALEVGAKAVSEGALLPRVIEIFTEYMFFATDPIGYEKRLRENCPGFLIGSEELTRHLGIVEKNPLPEWIWEMANEPCPIYSKYYEPEKKVWQSHMLVLIPETVNGEPLTLERLGALVKKGFPGKETGYRFIGDEVFTKYGRKPAGKSHWILISRDLLPISRSNTFECQKTMVKNLKGPYQVPKLLDMAVSIFMKYLTSDPKECLFGKKTMSRCQEVMDRWSFQEWCPVVIGNFSSSGLEIAYHGSNHPDYDDSYTGVGAEIVLVPDVRV